MLHLDLPRAPKETWATSWRKFRASYAVHRWMRRQRRPCWRTRSGWGGSRYVCQVKRYEKVRCNVVKPCKPNHRPPILEALSIGWGRTWSDDGQWSEENRGTTYAKAVVFPMCFTNHWKFKSFFGGKTCWSCFVWEIVHHFREFFSEAAVFPVFLLRGK